MTAALLDPLAWLIVLPLGWAGLALLLGPGRGGRLALLALPVQLLLALVLARSVLDVAVPLHALGGWGASLGIELLVDGLAVSMLLLAQLVALPVAVYARVYFAASPSRDQETRFWPLAGLMLAAMNALFVCANLFYLYLALELLGLAAVGLVALGGGVARVAPAQRYLLVSLVASLAYLIGLVLVYIAYGTASMSALAPLLGTHPPWAPLVVGLAAALLVLALLAKSALFPFHFWLPAAHAVASAPVAALLSALVVKAGFYLVLRLWLGPWAPVLEVAGWLLGALGALAILWGSWLALRSQDIMRLVACSTVAQLGFMFLVFPLLAADGAALQAGVMQVWSHGLAKAAMFMAAGVFVMSSGNQSLDGLAGAAERLPLTLFGFGLAGMTLMGVPPTGGFLAKWWLIEAALTQGQWVWLAVQIVGSLLAAAYVFRVLGLAFTPAPATAQFQSVPRTLEWSACALALASLLIGLRGQELVGLLAN